MGALPPASAWIPEDDILLKNAIEAGASIESLAKGAVRFSRKFTIQELHDRWNSLLYDPVVSEEASYHMIDFESSVITLTSKFNGAGNSKENRTLSEKRRSESVRTCYHAMRKRVRNKPFNSTDLSFLVPAGNRNYVGVEDEPLPGNCMLVDPISDNFGLEESNMDFTHDNFEEFLGDNGAAHTNNGNEDGFHATIYHQDEDDFPHVTNNHDEIPDILGANEFIVANDTGIEGLGRDRTLSVHSLLVPNHLMGKSSSSVDQINDDLETVCPEFEGNQVFNSQVTDYGASFHNLEYSSPFPGTSFWRIDEGLATSAIDDSPEEKNLDTDTTNGVAHNGDGELDNVPENDVCGRGSEFKSQMPSDELKSPTVNTEGYLMEITNTLLNDESFFIDVDAKDVIDKSYYDGLSSLLLNSPNEANQDQVCDITEQKISVDEEKLASMSDACPGKLDDSEGTHPGEVHILCKSQDLMISSGSASNSQFPELIDGRICCVLNTEDLEIPCNDNVVLLYKRKPKRWGFKESHQSSASFSCFSANPSGKGDRGLTQNDNKDPGQYDAPSQSRGSPVMPLEMGQLHAVGNCMVEVEGSSQLVQVNSMDVGMDILAHQMLVEENKELTQRKHDVDVPKIIQNRQTSNGEVESVDVVLEEQLIEPRTSDLEEFPVESDDDIPYFSDIEAMVLDMDLDPNDQNLFDWEVERYQDNDAKRTIIRLEQVACSYMQRAIAAHGAFAILYGHHSKHYIRKTEVLLGRATEDVVVDIDLGTEGCANKISRRQAIINMDKDGSFYLKNLGKFSVSVNGKEIAPGQSTSINSNCLIEIRGIPYIFDMNQTCVKQYLDRKGQNQGHQVVISDRLD